MHENSATHAKVRGLDLMSDGLTVNYHILINEIWHTICQIDILYHFIWEKF